ncbi:MAG TPA: hypothetical protein VKM72_36205 [Thermoanaerobaculia bacterium]|nr:hypothetical protein [Thermoanaerobaculia bacterium]
MKRSIVCCAVLALFLATLPLAAQSGAWTAVGSTGSIDEASLGSYAVGTTNLLFQAGAVGTIVSRFNVTNTYGGGITDTPPWTTLELTYFDIDPASTVSATLFRVNRCSNVASVVCGVASVDSTSVTCVTCTFPSGLNFGTNNYVVEVKVSRTATNVAPQLFGLRIF